METLSYLPALLITPVNEQERAQAGKLAEQVQEATQRSLKPAHGDQGYKGPKPAAYGIEPEVIKLAEAKRGFVLLLRRWVVERSLAKLAHFRRLSPSLRR